MARSANWTSKIAALLLSVSACWSSIGTTANTSDGGTGSQTDAGGRRPPDGGSTADDSCAAIANLVVTSTSATAIELSWTGAPGTTIQVARESYCGAEGYVLLATLPAGATSYTDNTVQAQWVYWYKITATDPTTGMTASAAIATQADPMPGTACSGGAMPRASGVSADACPGEVDGGNRTTTDSGATMNDGSVHIMSGSSCPIAAGASPSTIQSTLNSCGSGNTAVFAAGTYGPITSTITIPCGVSLSGPPVPYSQAPNQKATINGSSSFIGWGFQTTPGCSTSQTIQYLEWNGQLPSNGGGFVNVVAGTKNLKILNSWLHGVNAPGASTGGQNNQADLIFLGLHEVWWACGSVG
jgi:hypothetical protein